MGLFSKGVEALKEIRESGFNGPVTGDCEALMSRTDKHGQPLPLFEGGAGHGTPDEARAGFLGLFRGRS